MSNNIIPPKLRVKTFVDWAEYATIDGTWEEASSDSTSLDEKINQWVNETKNSIHFVSPPQVQPYYQPEKKKLVIITSVSVLYMGAVEQQNERIFGKQEDGKLDFGPPATDPGNTAVTVHNSDGISGGDV